MLTESSISASPRVQREWLRRVEAEYRSAAITQHLTLWLIQIAAPPELISDGLAIVADEMNHARLSYEVYQAAGGEGGPRLVRETLQLPRSSAPLEHDVFLCNLRTFVLGETVAVRLFKRLRESCQVPLAREALDSILVDEVRHRDFGWTTLEWMLSLPGAQVLRAIADRELTALVRQVRENYGGMAGEIETEAIAGAPTAADQAWGLMPHASYREAVALCLESDYGPRFAALGITI